MAWPLNGGKTSSEPMGINIVPLKNVRPWRWSLNVDGRIKRFDCIKMCDIKENFGLAHPTILLKRNSCCHKRVITANIVFDVVRKVMTVIIMQST